MKAYKIVSSDIVDSQIRAAKRYISLKFGNKQAVNNLTEDIKATKNALETCAYSMPDYHNTNNQKYIHLAKHRYKFVYTIHDDIVLLEEFIHDLQDEYD